jgi:hypothetical protein
VALVVVVLVVVCVVNGEIVPSFPKGEKGLALPSGCLSSRVIVLLSKALKVAESKTEVSNFKEPKVLSCTNKSRFSGTD